MTLEQIEADHISANPGSRVGTIEEAAARVGHRSQHACIGNERNMEFRWIMTCYGVEVAVELAGDGLS